MVGVKHLSQNVQTVLLTPWNEGWCLSLLFAFPLLVAYPGILSGGGGGSTNSVEDRGQREWGSGGGSLLVGGSGGSCNLIQEISFHVVKFS